MQWQLKEESYMKKCLAILLCMAMLIGLPFSVQAISISKDDGLTLINAYAMTNRFVLDWTHGTGGSNNMTDYGVLLYFNTNVRDAYHIKNNNHVRLYIEPYKQDGTSLGLQDAKFHAVDYWTVAGTPYAGTNKKAIVLAFNDSTKGFSYWQGQEAVGFRLYIVDNKGTGINNTVDGWATTLEYKVCLNANAQYDGRDAVIKDILFEKDCLSVKSYLIVSDSKIRVQFSEPVAMAALAENGPLSIELHATLGWINVNNQPGNEDGKIDDPVQEAWPAVSAKTIGDGQWIEVDFGGTAVSDALAFVKENSCTLNLHFSDHDDTSSWGNYGEQTDNGFIDGIWAVSNNCPLLAISGKHRTDVPGDTRYKEFSYAARIGDAYYHTVAKALAAAKAGQTITVLTDDAVANRIVDVPAGVTLDLNGYRVMADNLIAFGQIVDSSDGKGALITSQNTAEAFVSFQVENRALPLYDTDCGGYRFFSYRIINAGTKFEQEDMSWVKYGFKIIFDSMKAYELLACEDNAAINVELKINGRSFSYRFSHKLAEQLYETVKKDFDRRGNYAITLKIKGLDALNEEPNIKACPVIYSSRDTIGTAETIAFRGTHDPYTAAKTWIIKQIKENTLFSFDYNGVSLQEDISSANPTWKKTVETTDTGWIVRYNNGAVETWSEITFDPEMASLEWTNYFKSINETNNTYPISNILAIDSSVFVTNPTLTTANGSTASATDFAPIVKDLTSGSYTMQTTGGRSSQGAFPYFDISNGEYGVTGGIGWTGNWKAGFTNNNGDVSITAGMQNTNIELLPGEQMRTPMIMIQFFKGDQAEGHNDLRRLILKNYTPQENGAPVRVPQFASTNNPGTESELIKLMEEKIKSRNADGLWIDANWYGELAQTNTISDNTWSKQVGNWYFDDVRYPNNNMLQLGNWMEENNKELLLWIEPERVYYGTELFNYNSNYVLSTGNIFDSPRTRLWNFANDAACDDMINRISDIIQGSKVTWYRQDFNLNPEVYWENADATNRTGMTEIQYITNLYRYLDELVERNPGLMIDNCASGGRRLDLEMMKRSVPLWRTDYAEDKNTCAAMADNVRSINYNLTWWLPIHGGRYPVGNPSGNDLYDLRAMLSAGVGFGGLDNLTEAEIAAAMAENKINREMMYGDYYMLSHGTGSAVTTQNAAYQFDLSEEGRGYVITFCPTAATQLQATYYLKGLQKDASYQVTNADTGEIFVMTGQELMTDGLFCTYAGQADTTLFYYNMV